MLHNMLQNKFSFFVQKDIAYTKFVQVSTEIKFNRTGMSLEHLLLGQLDSKKREQIGEGS